MDLLSFDDDEHPLDTASSLALPSISIHNDLSGVSLQQLSLLPVDDLPPTPMLQTRPSARLRTIGELVSASTLPSRHTTLPRSQLGGSASERGDGLSGAWSEGVGSFGTAGESVGGPPMEASGWGPKKRVRSSFTQGERKRLYDALSQFGTDFGLMSLLFPGRSRIEIKKLYLQELRHHPQHVTKALSERKGIDETDVLEKIKERRRSMAEPIRELGREEEDYLREIKDLADEEEQRADGSTKEPSHRLGKSFDASLSDLDFSMDMEGPPRQRARNESAPSHEETEAPFLDENEGRLLSEL